MLRLRLTLGAIVQVVSFSCFLLLPAGTLHWWRAWVFLGVVYAASAASMFSLYRSSQALLQERIKPPIQKGQPLGDRIVLLLFVAEFYALLVLISLDVFQFHLLPVPGAVISSLGLVLFVGGWIVLHLSLRENTFAASVVRHQEERDHMVIGTGVYGIVRHPMYAGGLLLLVGMPLWLESYAATVFAIVPIATLAVRIVIEERFLRRELKGYEAYVAEVPYRLIPFLW